MLKQISETISDLCARVGATYRYYLEQENEKLRASHKEQQAKDLQQQLFDIYQQSYFPIAQLLQEAINNTSELTNIVPVRNPDQLAVTTKCPVEISKYGYPVLIYKAWTKRKYDLMANQVAHILEEEINTLTGLCNLPRLIVRVKILPTGRVRIAIATWQDWSRGGREQI